MHKNNLNILIVEDEIISTQYLSSILDDLGFINIFDASNMDDALKIVETSKIHIVFMDINIDGVNDGIYCAKVLNQRYSLPIIFTTAYGDSSTILEASETNIFGYLIKPFEANEVEATLTIALKRTNYTVDQVSNNNQSNNIIDLGNNQKYNLINKTFTLNGTVIDFTDKELTVLFILSKNLNQNISYDTLKYTVWKNKEISNSTIRDIISRIKKKIPLIHIENIVNFGYILKGKI